MIACDLLCSTGLDSTLYADCCLVALLRLLSFFPCQPDHVDYCELVLSLCDMLSLLYSSFLHPSCSPPAVHDAVLRLDRKLRTLVLAKIANDLSNDVCAPLLKMEMKGMLNAMFIDAKAVSTHFQTSTQLQRLTSRRDHHDHTHAASHHLLSSVRIAVMLL